MPNQRGTAQHRFRAGFTGIADFGATKISGGGEEHKPEVFRSGNTNYESKVSGYVNVSDLEIELVLGHDQNAIDDLNRWFDEWFNDTDKTRRGGFVEDLDEAGQIVLMARELVDCMPVKREHSPRETSGSGVSTITFVIAMERVFFTN